MRGNERGRGVVRERLVERGERIEREMGRKWEEGGVPRYYLNSRVLTGQQAKLMTTPYLRLCDPE